MLAGDEFVLKSPTSLLKYVIEGFSEIYVSTGVSEQLTVFGHSFICFFTEVLFLPLISKIFSGFYAQIHHSVYDMISNFDIAKFAKY